MNELPYEIISAPGSVYRAPVGTQFPDPDADPGMQWSLIGTSGDLNLTDAGITVGHPQTINKFRPLGSGAPAKAWRSEEDLIIRAVLADLTLEQYIEILNRNTVTETDGFASAGFHRGISVAECALLVRFDVSPYRSDGTSQFEVPRAVQLGQPEVMFKRGTEPAALALEWHALIDTTATSADQRLGRFIAKLADT